MTRLITRAPAGVALAAVAGLVLAGCGSSNDSSSSSSKAVSAAKPASTTAAATSGQQVKLAADEDGGFYFNPKKGLKAKAGQATLVMTNPKTSGLPHAIAIEGQGLDKDGTVVQPGGVSKITVSLKPGKYTYYCPVDSHRKKGMQGTLVVK